MSKTYSINFETWLEDIEESALPVLVTITIIESFLFMFLK
jgi:hypothetical protein